MKFKDFFALVVSVIKDWRVIVTLVAMLFVMWAANVIITYKKKPRKSKKRNAAPAAAPAKPAEEKKEASQGEASES
ncbi:MAG: hypothetical protein J6X78_10710 [Treponema sp.]|nr:hypothetical protein [Treponema sp.]